MPPTSLSKQLKRFIEQMHIVSQGCLCRVPALENCATIRLDEVSSELDASGISGCADGKESSAARETGTASARSRSAKRVCMVTHSFYESDNRVIRYAETLARRGDSVDVIALRRTIDMPAEEVITGVRVIRIQDRFGKKERSSLSFLWPLLRFLFASAQWITRSHRQNHYDLIHIHNIPDFLVFAAWYPKITGVKVILDIHDIVPEFFLSKFGSDKGSAVKLLLILMERISAAFADHVIIANHLWLDKYVRRSAPLEKCSVFINHVDSRIFKPRVRQSRGHNPVIMFPGSLEWHQGLDIAVRAFAKLRTRIPAAEFHIYGEGIMKPALVELVKELALGHSVIFFDPLPIQEIADVLAQCIRFGGRVEPVNRTLLHHIAHE
jgi:glycosyltransferase involved in cell wall biosynthesis